MKKLLIADSGATKTDWLYVDGQNRRIIRTTGLHPSFLDTASDLAELRAEMDSVYPDEVRFFGTALGNPESDQKMQAFLQQLFPSAKVIVKSDLEGAGRAFFGNEKGIVAVLGTGSVCARIENGNVIQKSIPLGFAIGDEGSAADLGRRILKAYYRKKFQPETEKLISERIGGFDYGRMMNRIYRSDKPNRELASVAGEVLIKPMSSELTDLIERGFRKFIENQLSTLNPNTSHQIVCTGKVADAHRDLLLKFLRDMGYERASIKYPVIESFKEQADIDGLNF
jgi:glucosamine kinase